jgi:hypothetical protein
MKKLCFGVVLFGWIAISTGCSETSATADEADGISSTAVAASQPESSLSKRESLEREIFGQIAHDVRSPTGEIDFDKITPVSTTTEEAKGEAGSDNTKPDAPKPQTAKTGDEKKDATEKAKPKPDKDGHLAPQQVASGGDGRAKNITFDNIKFPMDDPKSRMFKRDMLTEEIEKLNGKNIRVRGFIFPGALEEFTTFVFVRDNQECCFGPGSAIYDSIMIEVKNPSGGAAKPVKFTTRPVTVEGKFEVKELIGPDKKHWSIYRITATKVE